MKVRSLLVIALVVVSVFPLVACSGGEKDDAKIEHTTEQGVKDSGATLRKPAAPGAEGGNSVKPTTD
ncbi:MAG: hypothetical protein ABUL49_01510 [bacterium]